MNMRFLGAQPTIVSKVSDLIGRTPLFELVRGANGARMVLKLESTNPTGSAKIRMARQMLDEAERDGSLRAAGRVIESTSGNTGMGLALRIGRAMHYASPLCRDGGWMHRRPGRNVRLER